MYSFSLNRIKAIIIRSVLYYIHNKMTLVDLIFWPALDIIVWGTTSVWFSRSSASPETFIVAILTGLVFWEMTVRSIYELSVGMIREIDNRCLITLFTTPLKSGEWIAASCTIGLLRAFISAFFCTSLVALFYGKNLLSIGLASIPFALALIVAGWSIGIFGASIMVYFGHKVQGIPWMLPYFFAPFSGITYPISALPSWMQNFGYALPTTYIFESVRTTIMTGHTPWKIFFTGVGISCIFLIASLAFFSYMFNKSKDKGLARL
ncbi:MAG: ABC-2 type transporter [candidate division TM6 bacterium GW2011_GWF2_38_10]|nr:MAG: ABC-2 type transporter [candidate division TM6 bacterium GW2011_GWF2_38_10]